MDFRGGESDLPEESGWVVIHGWTGCSVKCGGGFSYQQRRCVKGKSGKDCLGDEVLQKTCNLQECEPAETASKTLKPVVRSVSTSDRPQSYEKCILKEGDLYLQLQIQNLREQPKLPVRVVINNHTLTIFSNKYYESLYNSYDLQSLQAAPAGNACFKVSDYRKDKTQGFCVIPTNLKKGETMEQQNIAINGIHSGVDEMKSAADQIARGFNEQMKTNLEFNRSLMAREEQIQSIFDATRYQMDTVEKIFQHFGRSEERLSGNAEKSRIIVDEINALESLTGQLSDLVSCFQSNVNTEPPSPAGKKEAEAIPEPVQKD